MPFRLVLAVLVAVSSVFAATASAAQPSGPPVPASLTLPTKLVAGQSTTGTVCLDQVAAEPTEVLLFSDNEFFAQVSPSSIVIPAGEQCGTFTVTASGPDRIVETESVIISAYANGTFVDQVLYLIPREGVDLIEITKADVNRNFTKLTVVATSDEPGAILTASVNGIELGTLEQRGDRYVGRFTLSGQPVNQVEVTSNLGGCAQRALPFGNNSNLC
jgi:hypothetical protein